MAEGKKKVAVTPLRSTLCIVAAVVQLIGMFFMTIGTPYDQLKITADDWLVPKDRCYSVWGTKMCGGNHPLAYHDDAFYGRCGVFEATLKSAAAFSIIAIFAFAIGTASSLMLACKCLTTKVPIVIIVLFGVITSAVPFAAIAGIYHNSQCNARFKDLSKYQPGFAFFVVSFCLEVVAFIIMCVA